MSSISDDTGELKRRLNMNKVILIGNLATDPEAFTTASGINRSTFRLAV